jgi:alpha-mannosidase
MRHDIRWTANRVSKIINLLKPLIHREKLPLSIQLQQDGQWIDVPYGTYWGSWNYDFTMRCTFDVPEGWGDSAALHLPLGDSGDFSHPEALIILDGAPFAGTDRHHHEIRLPKGTAAGTHTLELRGWTGLGGGFFPRDAQAKLFMGACALVRLDEPLRDLLRLMQAALDTAKILDENNPAKASLLTALEHSLHHLNTREPFGEPLYASAGEAHARLAEHIAQAGSPLPIEITATGHGHIDIAWLWIVEQGARKAGRTFHSMIHLMDQYPEFHYTQSQPQLYDFIRRDHPALFRRIQEKTAAGQWEPTGGMWVEADCNLSGAEALVRQFLLGQQFYEQHFAADHITPILWLPDVFGYCANLPQLIKGAGLEYFFTIKIGWNQYNRLPYDSFWWQGIDGTRVLTHFSTTPEGGSIHNRATYNAFASPESALGSWVNVQEKDVQRDILMSYGWGDGGGGPTPEMIENIRLMNDFPALPKVRQGSAYEFFQRLERNSGSRLPLWVGELYLEYHRGTYTTQGKTKWGNRKAEFALHDAEFLASLAHITAPDYQYPSLTEAWQQLCLNQFHDILPGSSTSAVYVEAPARYQRVISTAEQVCNDAIAAIAQHTGGDLLAVNPTGFSRHDVALWRGTLPTGYSLRCGDVDVQTQPVEAGTLLWLPELPPYSVTPLHMVESTLSSDLPSEQSTLTATPNLLENDLIRVEFDSNGDISRIYDKRRNREVLQHGAVANQFQAFEDRPVNWEAWDVEIYYEDSPYPSEPASQVRVLESGALRATLEVHRPVGASTIVQHISIFPQSPHIEFRTVVDWRERNTLLKVAFPLNVLSPTATYEIQWGNVTRPTHRNTSWDWARFETCAHKWVDLSEGNYGVSLLNDCKYGHDVHGNVLRLTLLRSPNAPDPNADVGTHEFTYVLYPHSGSWKHGTVAQAYALNDPMRVYDVRPLATSAQARETLFTSLVQASDANIAIETVKHAEDGNGYIVRFYEFSQYRGDVTLQFGVPIREAYRCNLVERERTPLEVTDNAVTVPVTPFQIVSLYIAI